MIEVRSAYQVRTKDIRSAVDSWRHARNEIWPQLGWRGRIQQMLHGHAQQSLFVWSSEWENLASWEEGMARSLTSEAYKEWSTEMNTLRAYGEEREVFSLLEPAAAPDCEPGRVEVRSSYLVPMRNVRLAKDLMGRAQQTVWPALRWSGQNQQMVHGKASQSMFVWSSTWDGIGAWEEAMRPSLDSDVFQEWYVEWLKAVDFGGPREVFKNL